MTSTFRAALAFLALGTLASCDDAEKPSASGGSCAAPHVSVGEDVSVTLGARATPTSAGTVCEGDVAYTWALESVPPDSDLTSADLDLTDPASPTFIPDVVGTYVLSVIVTDVAGTASAAEYVAVTVAPGNAPAIADCGHNKTANLGQRVDLDGSGSSDPEGAALEYTWRLSSGPACSGLTSTDVFDANTASPSLVPDCAGVFIVGLAVSDGSNGPSADYCSVTVADLDHAPTADAGESTVLPADSGGRFELDGYGSYDPEGAALDYVWTLLSAPSGSSGSLEDPTLPNPVFHWDVVGTYTFQLQVFDGALWSAPDLVVYTISG